MPDLNKKFTFSITGAEPNWRKLISSAAKKCSFEILQPISSDATRADFYSKESLSGFVVVFNGPSLQVETPCPSLVDWTFLRHLGNEIELAGGHLKDGLSNQVFSSEKWPGLISQEHHFLRNGRKVSLKSLELLTAGKKGLSQVEQMAEYLHKVEVATSPEVYPIDDKESTIWNGELCWVNNQTEQILFSQKSFAGKLCGAISYESLKKAMYGRVLVGENGFLLPEMNQLSESDYAAISIQMEHFEKPQKKKINHDVKIAVGDLERIAYGMAENVFSGKSLSTYTDSLKKEGFSEEQVELASFAVSGMLEIAATSKGSSLQVMTEKLIATSKLTPEAAMAVSAGFVRAATEHKVPSRWVVDRYLILFIVLSIVLACWLSLR
jgi:hypothetical protein